ncbi:general secretion pathway protein GspK [Tahibacter amnicola]|uniref:General secretion pathway protein GspK n=1 Tax=Tahibacter amnicola TaxID=2976241 RepID=A0ABY6BDW8_9GAMM|nr:general secretion pathway protein GspK [Tahibacter amnicola]UXI67786.1 general secretion pathway protein GspK [Tahibacter amnicola]
MIRHPRQTGVAFIIVLWVIALIAIILGSFAVIARTEGLQARHLFDATTARYAAEAGIHRAAFELRNPDIMTRWVADGRPYEFDFDGTKVEVKITDDSGKIDINVADNILLKALFVSAGIEDARAEELADAIVDWRDPDELASPKGAEDSEYKSADLKYLPRNAPFETVSEIQQVLGMDYDIYHQIENSITLYSGRSQPSPGYAPIEVLRALPGMTEEYAQMIVTQRQAAQPGSPPTGLMLPDGTPVVAEGGGLTYSIESRATLPNGASARLDATIRLGGTGIGGKPFVVLRWRDGENS